MKIAELAKKTKIPSKELLIQVIKLGIAAQSAQTSLSDDALEKVLKMLSKKKPSIDIEGITKAAAAAKKKERPAKKSPSKAKAAAPVKAKKKVIAEPAARPAAEKKTVIKKEVTEPEIKKVPPEIIPPEKIVEEKKPEEEAPKKRLQVKFPILLKDLAQKMSVGSSSLIKSLMGVKIFVTINQLLREEDARKAALLFGYELETLPTAEEEVIAMHEEEEKKEDLVPRPPVVTFMGHVDHGKTSLLDYIRKSKVADKETGGITQHIGAYEVYINKGKITFLDTPGHAAFTAMRARGANATDIVVLVVAADDGIMPQTIEALDHARAANVPVIVAINKIDKANIEIDRVKKQLSEIGLLAEDWGGKTITVGVSAKTGQGVDELLEMILLEAEMLELKANPNRSARGVVVEAKISKGGGPIATVLVKNGTLRREDIIIAGPYFGKIRALINDRIHRIQEAPPSMPVEVLGLNGVPHAGDIFMVVEDEKKAREICESRMQKVKEEEAISATPRITLEGLYAQIQKGKLQELKVILKADVRGSLEAITDSLNELSTKSITLNIIHKGVGDINDSDILLAAASNAIVIGFHVGKTPEADTASKAEHVDLRIYNIIYEAISDIKAAMEGMLEPDIKEVFMGRVLIKQVFKLSTAGIIAGSFVQKGKVTRNANCRLVRDGKEIYKGRISSLKRFKDDVKEMAEGFECGITFENFKDMKAGDTIEVFSIEKIARRL